MINKILLASALLFGNAEATEQPIEPSITEPTFEEKTYTLIDEETGGSLSVILKTEKDCVVIINGLSKNATYTLKESVLRVDLTKSTYFTCNILEDKTLEFVAYDFFEDITYKFGEKTIVLKSETECEIIEKDTTTIGTYVLDNDTLTILTTTTSTAYTINEDGTLTEKANFDLEEWLKEFFNPQSVATILSWASYIITIIIFAVKLITTFKDRNNTLANVKEAIMTEIGDKVDKCVKEQLENGVETLIKSSDKQNQILKLFAQILALSQENTPASRTAIIQLISKLGVVDEETIDTAIKTIKEEEQALKKTKEDTKVQVENVLKETSNDGTSI